jgi:hypothetical protein
MIAYAVDVPPGMLPSAEHRWSQHPGGDRTRGEPGPAVVTSRGVVGQCRYGFGSGRGGGGRAALTS